MHFFFFISSARGRSVLLSYRSKPTSRRTSWETMLIYKIGVCVRWRHVQMERSYSWEFIRQNKDVYSVRSRRIGRWALVSLSLAVAFYKWTSGRFIGRFPFAIYLRKLKKPRRVCYCVFPALAADRTLYYFYYKLS